jgi:eukaryotic-like serine/threonine-protein kinase
VPSQHPPIASSGIGCEVATAPAGPHVFPVNNPALRTDSLSDRYDLLRELGQGGMATVHLARDRKHNRDVAIKMLRPDLSESLGRERFLREIGLAARLTHPHILPLYDSGESDGVLFFVMPVMEGQTLRERLNASGPLPVDEAVRIATEVADALDYAHRHDIVHRDIKPENILLHEGHAVVADFGIGKALVAAGASHATVTQVGVTVGTPAYLSPEQAAGDELDGRSDLFALGCLLFEMLTGKVAFTGPSLQAVIAKRFVHSPPPVTAERPEVSDGVTDTVTRLLQREACDRFATGAEVVAALRSFPSLGAVARVATPDAPRNDKSIAVLPFTNVGADPENEFFSDGLTEEIITDLATVKALRVISRGSSQSLKGTTKGVREIGRTLGVRYALTGGVRRAGNALRVTAQLVDTNTEEQLWAEKFNGTLDDVFDMQERVSRAIVSALQVRLTAREDARLAERPIKSVVAFELYLKAQELTRRYGASMDHVLALLDRAEAIEGPALPLRALRVYVQIMQMRAGMATDPAHLVRASADAHDLLEAAPHAPYGYALLGFIAYEQGDLAGTVRWLRQALERDASDADAEFFLGIALEAAGQGDAAIAVGQHFVTSDPLSPMAGILLGSAYWFVGRPAERLDALEQAMMLDPDNPIIRWSLGYTLAGLLRADEARPHADWMKRHSPQMPYTAQLMALLEAMDGRRENALAEIRSIPPMRYDAHLTFHLAEGFAMAGEVDTAIEMVADAVERGFYPRGFIAEYCTFMAPLRGSEAFARVVERAGQREAEFKETI